jgi:uncharacterized LabA/DUF88 family protein
LFRVLVDAVSRKCGESAAYSGTHVYASVDPNGDAALRRFLHAMNSFPGYSVLVKERKVSKRRLRCSACGHDFQTCPNCDEVLRYTTEKGVDTALAVEMIELAIDDVYDVAVLGSTDADLCPAVKFIYQRTGKRVFNLWFPKTGHELRNACYDHFPMTGLLSELTGTSSQENE